MKKRVVWPGPKISEKEGEENYYSCSLHDSNVINQAQKDMNNFQFAKHVSDIAFSIFGFIKLFPKHVLQTKNYSCLFASRFLIRLA